MWFSHNAKNTAEKQVGSLVRRSFYEKKLLCVHIKEGEGATLQKSGRNALQEEGEVSAKALL